MTGLPIFRAECDEESCPIIPLPADATVAHAPSAASRTDLVAIQEHTARMACLVLGVPPVLLGLPQTGAVAAATGAGEEHLRSSAQRFETMLTGVLLDVYDMLYDERDRITVVFPAMRDASQMDDLFTSRVVTYDTYKDAMAQKLAVSKKAFEKKDPREREEELQRAKMTK